MTHTNASYDVIVVGAGNAALCAALSAAEAGASVLVMEKAPHYLRGGNTYFTGGLFRFAYDAPQQVFDLVPGLTEREIARTDLGEYPQPAFERDMMRMTGGRSDPGLARVLASRSYPTVVWMRDRGVRWALAYGRQAFERGGRVRFWGGLIVEAVGGGVGLSDRLFELAERAGVTIAYEAAALRLETGGRGVTGVTASFPEGERTIRAGGVVLASGGFQADAEMRERHLGPAWASAKVRGTRFDTGDGIRMALDAGAQPHGDWGGCHAVAWDLNAPPFGDRKIADLYQKHSYPFGIVVDVDGQRFVDEGADFRNYTYARYGREILTRPHGAAFQVFDAKTTSLLRDEYRIPQVSKAEADAIPDLAGALGIDPEGLARTVRDFNDAVQPGGFDPTALDGKRTLGIDPPKSNWALPLDTPPYVGYAVTCGITFTFGGLKIDEQARVLDSSDNPIPSLYAAGELVGGLFYDNYPGGSGLMSGAVFGRIAGANAAGREGVPS